MNGSLKIVIISIIIVIGQQRHIVIVATAPLIPAKEKEQRAIFPCYDLQLFQISVSLK